MTGSPPTLRLLAASENDVTTEPATSFVSDWDTLCDSFAGATGARLAFRGPNDPAFPNPAVWETPVPAAGPYAPGTLGLLPPESSAATTDTHRKSTEALAKHVGQLVQQLHESHRALWQRNAELATAIPMIVDSQKESAQLADRFAALLSSVTRAAGGDAAAMYILDDATQLLQLRAHHGLDHSQFTSPPRDLRHSQADLEALAGHAIVLDDTNDSQCLLPDLGAAHPTIGAAICVPISSASMPLGTLWVVATEPKSFSDAQVDMVEIIAGRLAVELEREILLREQGALGSSAHVSDAIDWQRGQLPSSSHAIDLGPNRWQMAARPAVQSRLHGDYFRWRAEDDDQVSLVLSTSHARGIPAALSAARMGGLISGLNTDNPHRSLCHINGLLWRGSAGDDQSSMFCGSLDQSTGQLTFCAAGMIDVYVVRPHGWEPILEINNMPAGSLDDATDLITYRGHIDTGDTLLVLSGRPRLRARSVVDGQVDGPHYAEAALHHNHLDADQLTTLLSGLWDHQTSPWAMPPAQLVARRI